MICLLGNELTSFPGPTSCMGEPGNEASSEQYSTINFPATNIVISLVLTLRYF